MEQRIAKGRLCLIRLLHPQTYITLKCYAVKCSHLTELHLYSYFRTGHHLKKVNQG